MNDIFHTCPFCYQNFSTWLPKTDSNLKMIDLTEIVRRRILKEQP